MRARTPEKCDRYGAKLENPTNYSFDDLILEIYILICFCFCLTQAVLMSPDCVFWDSFVSLSLIFLLKVHAHLEIFLHYRLPLKMYVLHKLPS